MSRRRPHRRDLLPYPDLNVAGFDETAGSASDGDADAERLYRQARDQFAAQPWVVHQDARSGGDGATELTSIPYLDGVTTIATPELELIRADGKR